MKPNSISYPFDQDYVSVARENAVQVTTIPMALGDLYALNTGAATVYLAVQDTAAGPVEEGGNNRIRIYPIAAGGYTDRNWKGGANMRAGVWVGAYSTIALALAGGAPDAGAVMLYEIFWRRGMYPNPV